MEEEENEWLPYLKNDVLSTAFNYARYSKGMEELTGFGLKNSLTLPSLANNFFNSLGDESDEPIYTYNDGFMGHFVSRSIKGGRCSALNQFYKSIISDEVFNVISKELDITVNGNVLLLDRSQNFDMLKGKRITAMLPRLWKKSFL